LKIFIGDGIIIIKTNYFTTSLLTLYSFILDFTGNSDRPWITWYRKSFTCFKLNICLAIKSDKKFLPEPVEPWKLITNGFLLFLLRCKLPAKADTTIFDAICCPKKLFLMSCSKSVKGITKNYSIPRYFYFL